MKHILKGCYLLIRGLERRFLSCLWRRQLLHGTVHILIALAVVPAQADGQASGLYKQGLAVYKTDPMQAYELFVQAAEAGFLPAMVATGHCYDTGVGATINYTKAIEWYGKAVEFNSIKACEGLARIYASCLDPKFHDGKKAVKYALAVVRKKPSDVQSRVLLSAAHARNFEFNKAIKGLSEARRNASRDIISELNEREERYTLGKPFPSQSTDRWIRQAANHESVWAMLQLARKYEDEKSSVFDLSKARFWYAKAASKNDAEALVQLGLLYWNGLGGDIDLKKAFVCFEQAAEQNYAEAYPHLGYMLFAGLGHKQNVRKAYLVLCQITNSNDQTIAFITERINNSRNRRRLEGSDTGDIYRIGIYSTESHYISAKDGFVAESYTVRPSPSRALVFLLIAAERGHPPAIKALIKLYASGLEGGGKDLRPDPIKAEMWRNRLEQLNSKRHREKRSS